MTELEIIAGEYVGDYDTINGVYALNYRPSVGNSYRIEASHTDYPSISAVTSIPVQNSSFEIELTSELSYLEPNEFGFDINRGQLDCNATISIEDPVGANYYQISVIDRDEDVRISYALGDEPGTAEIFDLTNNGTQYWEVDFNSNHVIFDGGDSPGFNSDAGEVFNDDLFDGGTIEISINFEVSINEYNLENFQLDDAFFYIEVRSLSEEYYQYILTTTLQKSITEDPFAEPVQIFSNVENGLGVFGGYNVESFEFNRS